VGRDDGRIRVLWLAKGLGPGGMERLLVNHARVGDRDRFEYHAAYLVPRPGSVVDELRDLGVESIRLTDGNPVDPRWVARLRHEVNERHIDVVHAHSPMPAAMARPALRAMPHRPALVYTEHNTWDCYGRATWTANVVTYPLDDAQFAVSIDARDSMPARLGRHVEPLTHGIDLAAVAAQAELRDDARKELGAGPDDVVVITVAHLRAEKAYDVLLRAARRVLDEHPNAMFVSVGHGPLEAEMQALHRELGLGDRFRFLGFRSDAVRLMAGADVLALSSHQEGLPLTYMESTALGLPIVSTAVGGLVDHVEPEVSGLLVPPGDPMALADALGRVVADPELRAALGRGAAAHAPTFDAATSVRRQEAVYTELVAKGRR
jgi:glycosyltransferase involved in cell wall biosynthesis